MEEDTTLSQEEIDALLVEGGEVEKGELPMTDMEIQSLTSFLSKVRSKIASSITSLLKRRFDISNLTISCISTGELKERLEGEFVVAKIEYTKGLIGEGILIISKDNGAIISDIVMGDDGTSPPEELDDLYLNALGEVITQMVNQMNMALDKKIEALSPEVSIIDFTSPDIDLSILKEPNILFCTYDLSVEGLIEDKLFQLFPVDLAKQVLVLRKDKAAAPPHAKRVPMQEAVSVHPVQFGTLKPSEKTSPPSNIDLLMDVPMQVTIELGRTEMLIKDILKLGEGSVVKLDKAAGEPVDLLVNGKLVAKGGVVVVDENFGVRITDIISPVERLGCVKSNE
ncbi:MAG: flagellar motor switch protein FliN [bacterium]|nr:flagellar motor switch protein FliN [bacterium]